MLAPILTAFDQFPLLEGLIIFFAALVHGAIGLGFPMTSTPLLATTGSLMRAIQLTLIPTLGVNVLMLIRTSQPFTKLRPYIAILPAIMVGTFIGSMLILSFNPDIFSALLAIVIMVFLWLDHTNQLTAKQAKATPLGQGRGRGCGRENGSTPSSETLLTTKPKGVLLAGLVTGILVGSVNAGVPALIIFALYNRMTRWQSIVLFNSCFLTGKLTQLVLFSTLGELNAQWQQLSLVLLGVAIIGVITGQQLGQKINQDRWRAVMRWVLLVIALFLLYSLISTD